ncbi:MAG: 2,3-diphosphoglycerate synthetase [Actinomycetota bacterium]
MRVLALVDGEHYPPVTRWGLETARERGYEVAAAILVGGTEKIDPRRPPDVGVPLLVAGTATETLRAAILEHRPEGVLDLSDEPVLGYRERMALVAVALVAGVPYLGPDFRLDPPIDPPALGAATIAVIGTGKRTGKTAVAGAVARAADAQGLRPIVIAMGRGGPPEPEVAERDSVSVERLISLVKQGRHAASDYLEDALMAGVTTIGARRAGGGLAGRPFASNVREAAGLALARGPGLLVLEGSGAAVPPVPWDAGVLVVPGSAPPEYLGGYLGPFRLLLSDLVFFTMVENPDDGFGSLSALRSHVRRIRGDDLPIIVTNFRPVPLGDVRGRTVFFTTTAHGPAAARQVEHLEAEHGCRVVGWSPRLADRAGLTEDIDGASDFEVLLTELKAAAIDIACNRAIQRGAQVMFVDNRAVAVEGDTDVVTALNEAIGLAGRRAEERGVPRPEAPPGEADEGLEG